MSDWSKLLWVLCRQEWQWGFCICLSSEVGHIWWVIQRVNARPWLGISISPLWNTRLEYKDYTWEGIQLEIIVATQVEMLNVMWSFLPLEKLFRNKPSFYIELCYQMIFPLWLKCRCFSNVYDSHKNVGLEGSDSEKQLRAQSTFAAPSALPSFSSLLWPHWLDMPHNDLTLNLCKPDLISIYFPLLVYDNILSQVTLIKKQWSF